MRRAILAKVGLDGFEVDVGEPVVERFGASESYDDEFVGFVDSDVARNVSLGLLPVGVSGGEQKLPQR